VTGFVVRPPAVEVPEVRSWEDLRLCVDRPDRWDILYPRLSVPNYEALGICQQCPVRAECLRQAVRQRALHVIRGGHAFRRDNDYRQAGPAYRSPMVQR
jgi:hypothetical protein